VAALTDSLPEGLSGLFVEVAKWEILRDGDASVERHGGDECERSE
jgi:hypothetical protein